MSATLPLFDLAEGERLKAEGIAKVSGHTETDYKSRFEAVVLSLTGAFTIEDVTCQIGRPCNHPNAIGAMMNGLAKRGLIYKTGSFVKAKRSVRHAGMIAEWRKR